MPWWEGEVGLVNSFVKHACFEISLAIYDKDTAMGCATLNPPMFRVGFLLALSTLC